MRVTYEHHNVRLLYVLPLIWVSAPLAANRITYNLFIHLTILLIDKL